MRFFDSQEWYEAVAFMQSGFTMGASLVVWAVCFVTGLCLMAAPVVAAVWLVLWLVGAG